MIIKINNELILIDVNKYNSSSELYLSLWKKIYNINIEKKEFDIQDISDFLNNKKIFI